MFYIVRRIAFCGVLLLLTSVPISLPIAYAADVSITITAQYRQSIEVTLDLSSASEISLLDPAIASAGVSLTPIQNLFLNLTDIDPVTNEVVPELATTWTVSEDGLIWTFTLREDVNWMQYDPSMGQATTIRPVVAEDFVYGIKRACDPRFGGYYGAILARVLAGCDVVNQTPDEEVTDELIFGDTIQAYALDDTTIELHLQFSAAYFLSMTPMWMTAAVPKEAINEFGDDWTAPGNIITNGPYFIEENVRGVRRVFVRNNDFPTDLSGAAGNIDQITVSLIEDIDFAFDLYQQNLLDETHIPADNQESILQDPIYQHESYLRFDRDVFYFGFLYGKPPFDNVNVRRAFSAIIDRQTFVDQLRDGTDVPMIHFTPPSTINSLPIDEIGIGFDPDFAREQMALAGYPNCVGFPKIYILTYFDTGMWGEFWVEAAAEHLGCDINLFEIEEYELSFPVFYRPLDANTPIRDRPHAWTLGWGPEYPDPNNWVGDVLHCESSNAFLRLCTETDMLINQAATELDPDRRAELYRQIEEGFFGENGEFPIAPIFMRANYILVKEWYTGPFETDGLFTGVHWNAYSIDMSAKLAVRGE